jgi:hypothetical protein
MYVVIDKLNDELEELIKEYDKTKDIDIKLDISLKLTELCGLAYPQLHKRAWEIMEE